MTKPDSEVTEHSHGGTAPHVHGPNCNHDHDHGHQAPRVRAQPKLGRNDPCHCGSGKKYKKCHESLDSPYR
jgi:hypothetical protein